jgi:uncharacterized protein (DUF305 family)
VRSQETALFFIILLASGCRSAVTESSPPPIVQPGAPGQGTRVISVTEATDLRRITHTEADVRFMQGMIGHHAQAIEMTALAATRAGEDVRKLAQRIEVSQADEIDMMRDWLTSRGLKLPDPHAHHAPGAALMPGMLTAEEMSRLAAATGRAFDRLFLEMMIRHHEGALTMVRDLFAARGAGQEPDVFAFASDVEADQRMEIDRMLALLATIK